MPNQINKIRCVYTTVTRLKHMTVFILSLRDKVSPRLKLKEYHVEYTKYMFTVYNSDPVSSNVII
jgi:hypothetical protein